VRAGASLRGFGTIAGNPITDNGAIIAAGGTLTADDAVSGSGLVRIDAGASFRALGALGADIVFAGSNATLKASPSVTGTIGGFAAHDTIDIAVAATTFTYAGGTLTLLDHGRPVDTLLFKGAYTAANFAVAADHHGGTDITFAASSMIVGHSAA
jgi:hypothetical protein